MPSLAKTIAKGLRPKSAAEGVRESVRFEAANIRSGTSFQKAIEMAKNGYSNSEIAEELDTSTDVVSNLLSQGRLKKGHDIPKSATGRQPTVKSRIGALMDKGLSDAQIATRLNISTKQAAVQRTYENKKREVGNRRSSRGHSYGAPLVAGFGVYALAKEDKNA